MDQVVASGNRSQSAKSDGAPFVSHFRNILIWPVHLIGPAGSGPSHDHAMQFAKLGPGNPWREVEDEFTGDPSAFQERHYNEFVTFLPPAQRFLYGQGIGRKSDGTSGESPIKVMRRTDISGLRVKLKKDSAPIELKIAHIDLYFFYDIDIAMLAVEVYANDIKLTVAQDLMYRFGRAYPAFWEKDGSPGHCAWSVELIGDDNSILASSDLSDREKYLHHVCQHRAPRIASHWEYLLNPMVPHYSEQAGLLRYRQLEYYRMPQMAFLGLDAPEDLERGDFIRLALANGPGSGTDLPYTEHHLAGFESKYCYDRYHERRTEEGWPGTRYMSCGHAFVVTGDSNNAFFMDDNCGILNNFRHQHFILFLIAHFHKAALLMYSDRLAEAVSRLDVDNRAAVQSFRAQTRIALENFLRFTHRYWFHAVSNQTDAHDLFAMCRRHLELDKIYEDIRHEVEAMSQYLENEATRQQNESMARLTVVTTFGLIGTVATGFLGMNLFDHTAFSPAARIGIFSLVILPTLTLTFLTVARSQRLSEFLDALANEKINLAGKIGALFAIFWRRKNARLPGQSRTENL